MPDWNPSQIMSSNLLVTSNQCHDLGQYWSSSVLFVGNTEYSSVANIRTYLGLAYGRVGSTKGSFWLEICRIQTVLKTWQCPFWHIHHSWTLLVLTIFLENMLGVALQKVINCSLPVAKPIVPLIEKGLKTQEAKNYCWWLSMRLPCALLVMFDLFWVWFCLQKDGDFERNWRNGIPPARLMSISWWFGLNSFAQLFASNPLDTDWWIWAWIIPKILHCSLHGIWMSDWSTTTFWDYIHHMRQHLSCHSMCSKLWQYFPISQPFLHSL